MPLPKRHATCTACQEVSKELKEFLRQDSRMRLSKRLSGIRRDVDEIYTLLAHDAELSGCPAPMFRHNVSVPSSRIKKSETLEDGTETICRKVGTGLTLNAA
jgi:hypothetical protein